MRKIGNPFERMNQMFSLIQHVTDSLRSTLSGEIEYLQTNTYLITNPYFEKIFNSKKKSTEEYKT